jgi:V8-like Glu-specific endopeptidase
MVETFALASVSAAVAQEAVRFLVKQTERLLRAWRQRGGTDPAPAERLDVPLEASPALEGQPSDATPDAGRVGLVIDALQELADRLSPVADGEAVEGRDAEVQTDASRLRQVLEALYGQRITFKGEHRPSTGAPHIVVDQDFRVLGKLVGISRLEVRGPAEAHVRQRGTIEAGGTVEGIGTAVLGAATTVPDPEAPAVVPPGLLARFESDLDRIEAVLQAARQGHLELVNEPGDVRRRVERLPGDAFTPEGIVDGDDSLWSSFLAGGLRTTSAVARVAVLRPGQPPKPVGTAVLISDRLVLSNAHVFLDAETAAELTLEFDYEYTDSGIERSPTRAKLDPSGFFCIDEDLDFGVVALADASVAEERHQVQLIESTAKVLLGERLNVIHHPGGDRKRISIRANLLVSEDDKWLRYTSDTRSGSSGSPVFNDQWEMVALHHGGIPDPKNLGDIDASSANEGARVSRIVARLRDVPDTQVGSDLLRSALSAAVPT